MEYKRSSIFGNTMLFLLSLAIYIEQGMGQTQCGRASASYSLPVASLCYKTSASAGRVVLDGYLTHNSSISLCDCTLTSTQSTSVGFTALNSLQPGYANCGSRISVAYGGTSFTINCFMFGKVSVSPTETVSISFEKPGFGYDSSYCMLLTPDNSNAVLTLNCNGDLNFPTISSTPTPTSSMTVTSAEVATSTRTTITTEPILTTVNVLTTSPEAGVFAVTSETSKAVSIPPLSSITTKTSITSATTIKYQTSTTISNSWRYTIPAIVASLTLTLVIILIVCYYERKIRKGKSNNKDGLYDSLGNNINLPNIRDHGEGSEGNYSNLSDVTGIYATIEENVRNDGSTSTNTMERTCSHPGVYVLQPSQDVPENTYKNIYTNYPRSDEIAS